MEWVKQFGALLAVAVVGVGLLIYGLWGELAPSAVVVEIVKSGEQRTDDGLQQSQIVVDIAGAVERPGVYKLPSGSRIGDALVMAGGLVATADREWVAGTINLAEVVKDGGKIYIPTTDRVDPSQISSKGSTLGEQMTGKININTASVGELDSLAGIGEVRARAIVESRPYGNIEELLSKAKIPQSVYEKIKDSISIY